MKKMIANLSTLPQASLILGCLLERYMALYRYELHLLTLNKRQYLLKNVTNTIFLALKSKNC